MHSDSDGTVFGVEGGKAKLHLEKAYETDFISPAIGFEVGFPLWLDRANEIDQVVAIDTR